MDLPERTALRVSTINPTADDAKRLAFFLRISKNKGCEMSRTRFNFETDHKIHLFFIFFFSLGVCPVLCSGHGSYGGGRCHCEAGWAGLECDLPSSESTDGGASSSSSSGTGFVISCSIPCSVHGTCVNGRCQCDVEHTGASCETRKLNIDHHFRVRVSYQTPPCPQVRH